MPQVSEFPSIAGESKQVVAALVRMCRETKEGEAFRDLRSRLAEAKLWDADNPKPVLRFLGVGGANISPSPFMCAVAGAADDGAALDAVADRLWELNPLLGKLVHDLLQERPYLPDEVYKQAQGARYRGVVPSRPALDAWFALAQGAEVTRRLGIALAPHTRMARFAARAAALDVAEFLAGDRPLPEPELPRPEEGGAAGAALASTGAAARPETTALAARAAGPASPASPASGDGAPGSPPPSSPSPAAAPRWLAGLTDLPRLPAAERAIPARRFGGTEGFSEEILAETGRRVAAWWQAAAPPSRGFAPSDFGVDVETWSEGPDEVLYKLAVAAALVFRLDADHDGVLAAYRTLAGSGVLGDLYNGTMPTALNDRIDARALMLASLVARRCAEAPDLAIALEQQKSAGEVFATLEAALGRGLFRIELFWLLSMLAKLGVIRHPDLAEYTAVPHRLVRDTLFRLGFLATPYAADPAALVAAAQAARRMAGAADPAEEAIGGFALAAGCGYDCAHRKTCDVPCRERIE
jgi:hypothetical protein